MYEREYEAAKKAVLPMVQGLFDEIRSGDVVPNDDMADIVSATLVMAVLTEIEKLRGPKVTGSA